MDLECNNWEIKLSTTIAFTASLYNCMTLWTLSMLPCFYRQTLETTNTLDKICITFRFDFYFIHKLLMTNGIIIFPVKKFVAALPTDWEVGGGPPGAAYLLVMTSFKRFNGNMFKSELLNCH